MEKLPDEIIYNILDRLDMASLSRSLQTSNTFRERFLPYFERKISDYEYEPHEESVEALTRKIEHFQNSPYSRHIYRLDPRLTRAMSLSYLPNVNGGAIVSRSLVLRWWLLYYLDNDLIDYEDGILFGDDFTSQYFPTWISASLLVLFGWLFNTFRFGFNNARTRVHIENRGA